MSGSIYAWSATAATNATADGDINWAEFQPPDTVNNSARQMMARIAEYISDNAPIRLSTGAANVYQVTSVSAPAALKNGVVVWFEAHQTNSGAATLSLNAFGSFPLRAKSGAALTDGAIQVGMPVGAFFKESTNEWLLVNSGYLVNVLAPQFLTSNTFGLKVGDIKISAANAPDPGFVRLGETVQNLNKLDYPDLHTWVAGQGYPWGSATSTFGIPPAAGYFLRFAATSSAVDTSGARSIGSTQGAQVEGHVHSLSATGTTSASGSHTHTVTASLGNGAASITNIATGSAVGGGTLTSTVSAALDHTHTVTVTGTSGSAGTGTETRATNVAFAADMLAVPALVASGLVGATGLPYRWDTGTTDADPGAGKLRLDSSSYSLATRLYISETGYNGETFAPVLATWDDSTSTTKGHVRIFKVGAPANYVHYAVTGAMIDGGSYDKFNLTYVSSSGSIGASDQVAVQFTPTGDSGAVISTGSVTLPNGLSSNITIGAASFVRIVGPTGVFSIGGFVAATGGTSLIVYNTVAFAMTIVNEDASAVAANRIKTLTGGNVTLRAGTSAAHFTYDATDARWILTSTN